MQGQNLHLLILLLFFGFSAVSWVIGKLREQAAIKKARDEMKRARDEQLRTGRAPEPVAGGQPPPARTSELNELRELAAKRQRQLEQMREMQQQGLRAQRTAAQTPARDPRQAQVPMPFPIPGIPLPAPKPGGAGGPGGMGAPGGPGVPRAPRPPTRRSGAQAGGGSTGLQDIRPGQPMLRPKQSNAPKGEPGFVAPPAFRTLEQPVPRRLVPDEPKPGSDSGAVPGVARRAVPIGLAALLGRSDGGRPSPAEIRRAVILSEIFGPPVSARRPGESGVGA